jgi:beta-lactamase regulating signal transducer with metallopeptidase domain
MSISGGVVAVLLFALKPLVRNRLPKSAQYYLWLVVIAALLVPVSYFVKLPAEVDNTPSVVIPSSVVQRYVITQEEELSRIQQIPIPADKTDLGYIKARQEAESRISLATTLFAIFYPFGALIVLLYFVISYTVYAIMYRRRNTEAQAGELAMLTELCGNRRVPALCRNALAATPILFGIFRPVIILPDREYTDARLRAVLLHELTHLRHKDILVKWLSVFACSIHWFNPIVWLVRREINRACELACDAAVIRDLDADGRQNYGETLLYVAADSKTPHAVLSTTMCEEKKALKERLGAILKSKKHTRPAIILSAALIIAVGGAAIALGAGRGEPLIEMKMMYEENPAYWSKDMKLMWGDTVYYVAPIVNAKPGREIGYATDEYNGWRIYELKGHGRDYLYAAENVSEGAWRVMSIYLSEQPWRQYILENVSDSERFTKMLSVTLYNDGTAHLYMPPISSYAMVGTFYYSLTDNELLIYGDNGSGGKGSEAARFEVIDDNTIIFRSADIPLFADAGARYVNVPVVSPTITQENTATMSKFGEDYSGDVIPLHELRTLAAKGNGLLMEDFAKYNGNDVGFGLYILYFTVEGGYELLVGSGSVTGTPMYVTLRIPGFEETIDIRNDDIDEFIGQYPVPNDINEKIHQYLDVIMSSPALSSATGDYIEAHRNEYLALLDMGIPALPMLTSVLESGDRGLRGDIAALLVQDIVSVEKSKARSEWLDNYLDSALRTYSIWESGINHPQIKSDNIESISINPTLSGNVEREAELTRFYTSKSKISQIMDYLNNLTLYGNLPGVPTPDNTVLMAYYITINYSDGTIGDYIHFGRFFAEVDGDSREWRQMTFEESFMFENILNDNPSD